MTDKELRGLKRTDLIEILYYLRRENDELQAENEKLNQRIDALLAGTLRAEAVSEAAPPDSIPPQPETKSTKSRKKR